MSFITPRFLAIIALLFLPAQAQAESFKKAVKTALENHPSVQAARAEQLLSKNQQKEQRADYLPEISVRATGGRIFGDNATSRGLSVTRGAGYSYLWEGSTSLTQKIFDGFETRRRVESAEARFLSAEKNVLDVRETLALQTAQSYFNVMRTRQAMKLISEHKQKIKDYHQRIEEMVEDGGADIAELKQAEDISILLDNIFEDYRLQHRNALAQYEETTGDVPKGELTLPKMPASELLGPYQEARAVMIANHPALQASDFRIEAGRHEIEAEQAALYPDINGELSYLKRDQRDLIGGEVVDARAVIKLNWTFSTGGAQFARIRQRQSEYFQQKEQKHELQRQLTRGLREAWTEYESSEKTLKNLTRRVEINESLTETNRDQFEVAQIRLLQLMQSENQTFQTKLERLNAFYRHCLAQFAVLAGMGNLQKMLELNVDLPPLKETQTYGLHKENVR